MKPVFFRPQVLEDVRDIAFHISTDSPRASRDFEQAFMNACSLLSASPEMGALRTFGNPHLTDVRFWPLRHFKKYLVVYCVHPDRLDVLRVVHGARDLLNLFGESAD